MFLAIGSVFCFPCQSLRQHQQPRLDRAPPHLTEAVPTYQSCPDSRKVVSLYPVSSPPFPPAPIFALPSVHILHPSNTFVICSTIVHFYLLLAGSVMSVWASSFHSQEPIRRHPKSCIPCPRLPISRPLSPPPIANPGPPHHPSLLFVSHPLFPTPTAPIRPPCHNPFCTQ